MGLKVKIPDHSEPQPHNPYAPSGAKYSPQQGDTPEERLKVRIGAEAGEVVLEDIWAVEDVLPLQGMGAIYGPPGSGKSLIGLSMALHMAAGRDWNGKTVEQCVVIYAALEGTKMFRNRVWAAAQASKIPLATLGTFATVNAGLDLRTQDGSDGTDLAAVAKQMMDATGVGRCVVFVDTLNRSFAGGNENSPEDMGALIGNCMRVIETVSGFLMLVHHSGKDVARGMRGHSSLIGAVETELSVIRKDEGRLLTVSKQRDGEDGEQFGFLVDTVEVGSTPKGKFIRAPYAKLAHAADIKDTPRPIGRLQVLLMEALGQLAVEPDAKKNPGGPGWPEPGKFTIVSVEALLNHAKGKMPPTEEGKKDTRRDSLKRALIMMVRKGVLAQNADYVWKL